MPFPKPLAIPEDIQTFRLNRREKVIRAVRFGIISRLLMIVFELCGIFFINSSTLLLDVISSLMDVFSSVFIIFCIKLAERPPDRNHPFGHGRYEPMGGMFLGIGLLVLGLFLLVQQVVGLFHPQPLHVTHPFVWLFPAVVTFTLELVYRRMIRTAKKMDCPSLLADAYHYRIDSLTSLFATAALFIAALLPEWAFFIDHAGAILIALFMAGLGFIAASENFHQLMDKIPGPQFFDLVNQAALQTPGVQATEKIRIQRYGPDAHIDIDIEVLPDLSVDLAHKISQHVRLEIQKAWPAVRDVTVHVEPYYNNDH